MLLDSSRSAARSHESAVILETEPQTPNSHSLGERLSLMLDFAAAESESSASSTHPHVLFSPIHYEPSYAYPLLVWLHDTGGDERQIMHLMPALSMRNYVAVAPQGLSHESAAPSQDAAAWSPEDIVSLLRENRKRKMSYDWPLSDAGAWEAEQRIFDCISVAKQRCNIASNRIFIGGVGNGGTMALWTALLNPEQFAGVISLGGAFPVGNRVLHRWPAARSLQVFLGAGRLSHESAPASTCRPLEIQSLELLHTAGVSVAVREYDGDHELTPAMLQDVNRWMMNIVCE